MILATERLVLRPPEPRDADAIERMISVREVAEMLGSVPYPYPRGGAVAWIATPHAGTRLLITRRDDGEVLGNVSLTVAEEHRRAELGYWLGVEHWGRGYMTEAVRRVLDHGFRDHALNRIFARVFGHNPASARVCRRVGMTHEGTLRQHATRLGRTVDMEYYGILRSEWSADAS